LGEEFAEWRELFFWEGMIEIMRKRLMIMTRVRGEKRGIFRSLGVARQMRRRRRADKKY